jgi:alkylation response protein AidB-like acyl-CoA dehydrogenase
VEFDWSPEHVAFREEFRRFLKDALPDNWLDIAKHGPGSDQQAQFSKLFCRKMAERGWLTQHWPTEYGGLDADPFRHAIVGEECWAVGEPRGAQYMNVNWIGPAIMKFGTPEQKAFHLPRMARGDALWCQGFSEPESGSDLASLRTRADKKGDDYIINGSKIWTSYVAGAEFCIVLARTDAESRGREGISVFLVPMDAEGVKAREIPSVIGSRYFHEVFFSDARVPASTLLGPIQRGWDVVTYALQFERVGAARYVRAALTLDEIAELVKKNGQDSDPLVIDKLGEARAVCEAARVLTYRVIDERAKKRPPSPVTQIARIASTQADKLVGDLALELMGMDGLAYGSLADANFRLAMTAGVAVGTSEVQLNLIASRVLGLPRGE